MSLDKKFCQECGSENYKASKFCKECGNPFLSLPNKQHIAPVPREIAKIAKKVSKKMSFSYYIAVIGVLLMFDAILDFSGTPKWMWIVSYDDAINAGLMQVLFSVFLFTFLFFRIGMRKPIKVKQKVRSKIKEI